jgi:hypothetical protein
LVSIVPLPKSSFAYVWVLILDYAPGLAICGPKTVFLHLSLGKSLKISSLAAGSLPVLRLDRTPTKPYLNFIFSKEEVRTG